MRSIGEVAAVCGVSPHLLRQWEDAGLLEPAREHGQRRYSELDVRLVRFIRFGRELGLGLAELRELFATRSVEERAVLLKRRKAMLEHRIAVAARQLELIEEGLACPYPDVRYCPDLIALAEQPELADLPSSR
ncbi:MerR family transcriptional regulator [Cryptosporangium japonicum]